MSQNKATILQYLNRLRPAGTDPELLYSPAVGEQVILTLIYVVNLDNQDREFSIYYDHDGNTTDETTAIAFEAKIAKNTTQPIALELPMRNSAGQLNVQTDKGNALNFQLVGQK
jgi:hypothetical protein